MHTVTHRDTHTVSSDCWLWNSCWVERALYVFEQWECSLHKYLIISGLLSVWKCIIRLVRITRQEDRAREKEQKGRGRVGKQKRSINCQSGVDTQLKAHHLNMSFIKKTPFAFNNYSSQQALTPLIFQHCHATSCSHCGSLEHSCIIPVYNPPRATPQKCCLSCPCLSWSIFGAAP